ncbi:DUF1203 domain-containing protein [Qipengyuania algicida]
MTYRIEGLDPQTFAPLFGMDQEQRAANLAELVTATSDTGFPCRVSLEDAAQGEAVMLLHHVSNDVARPFRMAHAIYVRQEAKRSVPWTDRVPPMLDRRSIGLRAFDGEGMMRKAMLAAPGEGDGVIRALFADDSIAYIHAHNAAYGCFLAAVERHHD